MLQCQQQLAPLVVKVLAPTQEHVLPQPQEEINKTQEMRRLQCQTIQRHGILWGKELLYQRPCLAELIVVLLTLALAVQEMLLQMFLAVEQTQQKAKLGLMLIHA